MIIKRFQAKTEQEAVENAKKELGPGVVIMNVKNVKKGQPTPVLLPGKSHGQRSVVGYSPWGRKELDTTE